MLLGPAFVAAVAYVDPGNFATNITGGAKYGYLLLWVILAANLMAMLIRSFPPKAATPTARNRQSPCPAQFPRPGASGPWIQAGRTPMPTTRPRSGGPPLASTLLFA